MLYYKFDVLEKLKEAGYSTYRLRKEKVLAEATIQKLREKIVLSPDNLNTLCRILKCQPGDLIGYKDS